MKNNGILILVAICLLSSASFTQVPNWAWAKSAGGSNIDVARCIAVDATGNVFVTGWFYSRNISFGSISLTNVSFLDDKDIFLVKYDASGNVVWAKSAGGNIEDFANSISVNNSGNIYITGYFNSDTLNIGELSLSKIGGTNIFYAKYDANGNVLWAKNEVGAPFEGESSIAEYADGFVYLVGESGSYKKDYNTEISRNVLDLDILVRKYNGDGNEVWSKTAQGNLNDYANSVAVDTSGNVYVAGHFESASIKFGAITLVNYGYNDIFLVKYNASGSVQWARCPSWGNNEDKANSVATDMIGNCYIAGAFSSDSISFAGNTLINANAGDFGREDIFLVKYDASGNVLWAKSAGGLTRDKAYSIITDANGDLYLAGSFESEHITFGTFVLTNTGGGGLNQADIFLVKFDDSGNVLWATSTGVAQNNQEGVAYSVATDITGNIFLSGMFEGNNLPFGTYSLENAGGYDAFLAKLGNVNGMNDLNYAINIDVYPNPTNNNLSIDAQQIVEIEIFNIQGQQIKTIVAHSNRISVDISEFQRGLYIIKVEDRKRDCY